MYTVQGWHFAEQVKGLHIRLSLEKNEHTQKAPSFFKSGLLKTEPFQMMLPPALFKTHVNILF